MIKLFVLAGPDAGSVFSPVHATVIIGHGDDCDVVLNDPSVARRHCSIQRTPQQTFLLSDLYSPTGTFVGDERIQIDIHELQTRDEIYIGGNRIRIQLPQGTPQGITSSSGEKPTAVDPSFTSQSDTAQSDSPAAFSVAAYASSTSAEHTHDMMSGTTRLKKFFAMLIPPLTKWT